MWCNYKNIPVEEFAQKIKNDRQCIIIYNISFDNKVNDEFLLYIKRDLRCHSSCHTDFMCKNDAEIGSYIIRSNLMAKGV